MNPGHGTNAWLLTNVVDPWGNEIHYEYDMTNGDARISTIKWCGSVALLSPGINHIDFTYALRADRNLSYFHGGSTPSDHLLTDVEVFGENGTVRRYQLKYAQVNLGKSYLSEIIEHGTGGARYNSTIFKYGDGGEAGMTVEYIYGFTGANVDLHSGDFDGNGVSDILAAGYYYYDNTGLKVNDHFKVYLNGSSTASYEHYFPQQEVWRMETRGLSRSYRSVDFNGDGRDDIFASRVSPFSYAGQPKFNLNGCKVWISELGDTPGSTFSVIYSGIPDASHQTMYPDHPRPEVLLGDFTGDGRADAVAFLHDDSWDSMLGYMWQYAPADWAIQGIEQSTADFLGTAKDIAAIQANDDGRLEILARQDGGSGACRVIRREYQGQWVTAFTTDEPVQYNNGPGAYDEFELGIGDFNGDGLGDLLTRTGTGYLYLRYGTGLGWSSSYQMGLGNVYYMQNNSQLLIGDFNGDGLSDLAHCYYSFGTGSHTIGLGLSKGLGAGGPVFSWTTDQFPHPLTSLTPGDFNGDGRMDLLNRHSINYPVDKIFLDAFGDERLLDKVINGVLNVVDFEYSPATYPGVYTDELQEHAYPMGDMDLPITVVHAVRTNNGLGDWWVDDYRYAEGYGARNGLGFLGFKKLTVLDPKSDRVTTSEYDALSDVAGLSLSKSKVEDLTLGTQLSHSVYSGATVLLGNQMKRYTTHVTSETHTDDLSTVTTAVSRTCTADGDNVESLTKSVGTVLTVGETFEYDPFGQGAPSEAYENRLVEHEITTTRTGADPITTVTTFDYDVVTGALVEQKQFANTLTPLISTVLERWPRGSVKTEERSAMVSGAPMIRRTKYKYDEFERATRSIDRVISIAGSEELASTSREYDFGTGLLMTEYSPDGLKIANDYDGMGLIESSTAPHLEGQWCYDILSTTRWAIEQVPGSIYKVTTDDPGAPIEIAYYDRLGRVIEVWVAGYASDAWSKSRTTYYELGRVVSVTDPALDGEVTHTTTYGFDEYERPSESIHSMLGTSTSSYAYEGTLLRTTSTDPAEHARTTWTDATGLTLKVQDAGGLLIYSYDSRGQVTKVHLGPFVAMTMTYDDHGHRSGLWDQSAGLTEYRHDPFGQLVWQRSANGEEKEWLYDELGRLVRTTELEGVVEYTYFEAEDRISDKPVLITGFGSTRQFEYDELLRPIWSLLGTPMEQGVEKEYTYDEYDRLTTTRYGQPLGLAVTRSYSSTGYLNKVSDEDAQVVFFDAQEMDGQGRYTKYDLVDGTTSFAGYEGPYPTYLKATGVQNLRMSWDETTGNLKSRVDLVKQRRESFAYDELDRLIQVRSYLTNAAGEEVQGLGTVTYGYDQGPDLSRGNLIVKDDVGLMGYSHNAVVSAVHNDFPFPPDEPPAVISLETQEIRYTSYQQPVRLSETFNSSQIQLEYIYGPEHQRVFGTRGVINGAILNTRLYDGDHELQHDYASGLIHHIIYVEGGTGVCAMVVYEGATQQVVRRYAVYKDHLGSIVALTRYAHEELMIAAEQSFDAWGRPRNPDTWQFENLPEQPAWLYRGYTGHEHVEPFSLINMNGRMYDPVNGRMLSVDNYVAGSFATQGINRYSYANNNPLTYVDPTGELAWFVPVIAGAFIGGYLGGVENQKAWEFWNWDYNDASLGQSVGIGALLGATAGAVYASAASAWQWNFLGGITHMGNTATAPAAFLEATNAGWNIASNALLTASVNIGTSYAMGNGRQSAFASGLIGLASGGLAAVVAPATSTGSEAFKADIFERWNLYTGTFNGAGTRAYLSVRNRQTVAGIAWNTVLGASEGYISSRMLNHPWLADGMRIGSNLDYRRVTGRYVTAALGSALGSVPGAGFTAASYVALPFGAAQANLWAVPAYLLVQPLANGALDILSRAYPYYGGTGLLFDDAGSYAEFLRALILGQ